MWSGIFSFILLHPKGGLTCNSGLVCAWRKAFCKNWGIFFGISPLWELQREIAFRARLHWHHFKPWLIKNVPISKRKGTTVLMAYLAHQYRSSLTALPFREGGSIQKRGIKMHAKEAFRGLRVMTLLTLASTARCYPKRPPPGTRQNGAPENSQENKGKAKKLKNNHTWVGQRGENDNREEAPGGRHL